MASRPTNFKGFNFKQYDSNSDDDNDNESDNEDDSNLETKPCEIYVKSGNKPYTIKTKANGTKWTLGDTVKTLKDYMLNDKSIPKDPTNYNNIKKLKLRHKKGVMVDDDKLLKYKGDKDGGVYLVMVQIAFRVDGGSKKVENEEKDEEKDHNTSLSLFFSFQNKGRDRKRVIKNTKKFPLSKEKCIITHEIDTKNNIYMPCQHTISPSALFDVMLWTFIKNDYKYDIHCPLQKCRKLWNFGYCCKAACLDKHEKLTFKGERNFRKSPSKKCPNCGEICDRPKDLRYYRVACICKKGDWCFECGKRWIGGGFTVCGNNNCHTSAINSLLKKSKFNHKVSGSNELVPELRACPSCYELIEHDENCKHMHCKKCGNYFCFVCLYVAAKDDDGKPKWNGDNCGGTCKTHGTQVVK